MSPPPPSRIITLSTFTEQQIAFIGPTTCPKCWGKKTKPTTKVTLASHQNHINRNMKLLFFLQMVMKPSICNFPKNLCRVIVLADIHLLHLNLKPKQFNFFPISSTDNGRCAGTRRGPNNEYEWTSYQEVSWYFDQGFGIFGNVAPLNHQAIGAKI